MVFTFLCPIFVLGFGEESSRPDGFPEISVSFFVMTTDFFNANVQIVNVRNISFRKNATTTYVFSSGFAFFVPGFGYLKFKADKVVYVLGAKKWLQSILDAGGFIHMNDVEFVKSC